MRRRYATVDVFTSRMFGGNPLAVVLDAAGLSAREMQAIASEFNYSETTFVLAPSDPAHTARVRIFTPRAEVPFAGHPNVGTAFVLGRQALQAGKRLPDHFVFEEAAGLVPVRLLHDGSSVIGAELTAPEPLSRGTMVGRERAATCLSLPPEDIRIDRHGPQVVSVGLPFVVVELASRDALRRAKPSLAGYAELLPLEGADAIYAYTSAGGESEIEAGSDLQARMFSPLDGIVEDPATGSATAAVAALLTELRSLPDLVLRVSQGVDMGRPSELLARVERNAAGKPIAFVGGRCVAVMDGSFVVDAERAS
jgi:trans-2,3-dihydro-3-hydroxyanthranilate isomerase